VRLDDHLFRCRVPEYIFDTHISRQLGQRFGNKTDTCFQPGASRAITMRVKDGSEIQHAPSLPMSSGEPHLPFRRRFSFGTLTIIVTN
jgi:hypothetical protein